MLFSVNPCLTKCNLKKQSQFFKGQIDIKSYLKGCYEEIWDLGLGKNKAKQSQFLFSPQHCWGLQTDLKKQSQFRDNRRQNGWGEIPQFIVYR